MTTPDCRTAMHDAERHARLVEQGNPFALSGVVGFIETATRAYMATSEAGVAHRLNAAIDRMEMFAA